MIRSIVLATLLVVLAALSAVEAGPRLLDVRGYARGQSPALSSERASGPLLAQARGRRHQGGSGRKRQGGGRQVIPTSAALRSALGSSPGSQGLGVSLLKDGRPVYAVKLKTGNRVRRVLVDAQTGQVLGE